MKRPIILSFLFIMLLPLMFIAPHEEMHIFTYLLKLVLPASIVLVFWVNYLWILPHYQQWRNLWHLVLCNVVMIVSCVVLLSFMHTIEYKHTRGLHEKTFGGEHHEMMRREHPDRINLPQKEIPPTKYGPERPHNRNHPEVFPRELPQHNSRKQFDYFAIFIAMKDSLYLLLGFFLAFSILAKNRMARLQQEKQEADAARQEAELCGLRNQVSPHFLLNTLNCIYSLSLVDDERTSDAVVRLSQLLRHTLYNSSSDTVSLYSEAEFVRSYVELMRLRLTDNVKINLSLTVSPDSETRIAPFIILCLLENAFKHGTDSDTSCHVDISISESDVIRICMCNSNRPRGERDCSGHGIGMELARKRLDYSYRGQYDWTYGVKGDDWVTTLLIKKRI